MDSNTPVIFAGGRYRSRIAAITDFESIWESRKGRRFDHLSAAVLAKDPITGELELERHNSTPSAAAWHGAVLGAALVLIAPPAGATAIATGGAAMAGAGGLVAHFRHSFEPEQVSDLSELLCAGESGLLLVAVAPKGIEITSLFANCDRFLKLNAAAGEMDVIYERAFTHARLQRS
jgi:hypothetical protein